MLHLQRIGLRFFWKLPWSGENIVLFTLIEHLGYIYNTCVQCADVFGEIPGIQEILTCQILIAY